MKLLKNKDLKNMTALSPFTIVENNFVGVTSEQILSDKNSLSPSLTTNPEGRRGGNDLQANTEIRKLTHKIL